MLEHGRIVEQGTHDELLRARGLYTSLYGDWAVDVTAPAFSAGPRYASLMRCVSVGWFSGFGT